jgi:hypothetical protein
MTLERHRETPVPFVGAPGEMQAAYAHEGGVVDNVAFALRSRCVSR